MTNNTRNAIYACLLLLAITVGACVKDSTVPESIYKQPQDFKFSDARAYFEENAKMPANSSTLLISLPTKSTDDDTLSLLSHFTVLWDNVQGAEMPDSYVYEIPLLHNIPLSASLFAKSDSGFVHTVQDVNLQSNLIIRKFHKTGKIRMFISTAVGRNLLPDSLHTHTSPLFWTGNKTHFEGYEFYTALNGEQVHYAYRFECGHKKKVFLDRLDNSVETQKGGFIFAQADVHTKSGEDGYGLCNDCGEELTITGYCNRCGKYLEGALIIGEVDRCPGCGETERLCRCDANAHCPICGNLVCSCYDPFCEYCGEIGCRGSCLNPEGPENPDEPPGGGEPVDTAAFNSIYIEIINKNEANGSITGGNTGYFKESSNLTLVAWPNSGYVSSGWFDGNDLVEINQTYSFTVLNKRCLTVNFYSASSDCGMLILKYKDNDTLKSIINAFNNQRNTNNNIEHALLRSTNNERRTITGESNRVKFNFERMKTYTHIIHNHPSGRLIPSVDDIYTIYKADSLLLMMPLVGCFIIQTSQGTLSIEISDSDLFKSFAREKLIGESNRSKFQDEFHIEYLGNPSEQELLQKSTMERMIAYYSQKGLKFAFIENNDGTGNNWKYVEYNNGNIEYNICNN